MNIYYTAKDIEELAAKGVTSLEIGARVFLTDFAYETAEQMGIKLVRIDDKEKKSEQASPQRTAAGTPSQVSSPGRYNKPTGCQHGELNPAAARVAGSGSSVSKTSNDGATVNRLIDIMGKMIKRGD